MAYTRARARARACTHRMAHRCNVHKCLLNARAERSGVNYVTRLQGLFYPDIGWMLPIEIFRDNHIYFNTINKFA